MANAIYTVSQFQQQSYRQQATAKQTAEPSKAEVTVVPTLVDLQMPLRKVKNALHWRRQWVDFFGSFVSGAVSLR